jgi:hypothetical protein
VRVGRRRRRGVRVASTGWRIVLRDVVLLVRGGGRFSNLGFVFLYLNLVEWECMYVSFIKAEGKCKCRWGSVY